MPLELATLDDLNRLAATLEERITQMASANQQDIDQLTTQVTQVATDLGNARNSLQAEIDSLAGQGVNVSALQAAVAPLDSAVQQLGQIQPTPAQPTPPPSA